MYRSSTSRKSPRNIPGTANIGKSDTQQSGPGQRLVPQWSHKDSHQVRYWNRNRSLGKARCRISLMSTVTPRSADGRPGSTCTLPTRGGMDSVHSGQEDSRLPPTTYILNRSTKFRGDESSRILTQCKNVLKHSPSASKEEHRPHPEAVTS